MRLFIKQNNNFKRPKQPYQLYNRILKKKPSLNFRFGTSQGFHLKVGVGRAHTSHVNELKQALTIFD